LSAERGSRLGGERGCVCASVRHPSVPRGARERRRRRRTGVCSATTHPDTLNAAPSTVHPQCPSEPHTLGCCSPASWSLTQVLACCGSSAAVRQLACGELLAREDRMAFKRHHPLTLTLGHVFCGARGSSESAPSSTAAWRRSAGRSPRPASARLGPARPSPPYGDEKVANREIRVWHFVIENGY
jgi:hypothetical protein